MPLDSAAPLEQLSIIAGGKRWGLVELPSLTDAPTYTCISYVCGTNKIANPFDNDTSISSRAITAIETILDNESPNAIWIDAFCVPSAPTSKSTCLSQLGAIFNRAEQVVVVLSQEGFSALESINESHTFNVDTITTLEQDDWVSRAWTYQEFVNNDKIRFATRGCNTYAKADDILNGLTIAIDDFKKERDWDSIDFYSKYPRISSFEDVIIDWKISTYLERSAYQALSCIDDRVATSPEDLSYLIGAINDTSAPIADPSNDYSFNYLMQVCEMKGDYSFIYTTACRSSESGRQWRPAKDERLKPIFTMHSWGMQSGAVHPTHITLNNMSNLQLGPLNPKAEVFLQNRLYSPKDAIERERWPKIIYSRLAIAKFSGCGDFLETEHGYFFTYLPIEKHDEIVIAISTEIQSAIGSPGLLLKKGASGIHEWHGVGLFVGRVPKSGISLNVG
ncbi:MAG: HET domain-containing protein [Opitutaceae bacterium]